VFRFCHFISDAILNSATFGDEAVGKKAFDALEQ
jgi:hypothetical protein